MNAAHPARDEHRLRVALVASSYDPYFGGVEEHTRHLAHHLSEQGHAVEVWTVDRGEHLGVRSVDGLTIRYLPAPLPARRAAPAARFIASAPRAWAAWTTAHFQFRPDVLNVQCFGPNGLYSLALHARFGTPLVLSSHGETFMDDHQAFDTSLLLRSGLRWAVSTAGVVTACSTHVAEDLSVRFGARELVVVPNAVELDEAPYGPPAPAPYNASPPTVFAVGRVERVKGFDLLLRAFAEARLPENAQLVIGGDGAELPHLRSVAADLGVTDRVVFPGQLTGPAVAWAMASASVIVVPSRTEAFGIVVLEAWRSGRPLIATRRGGPGTLVTDGEDGVLVDPEDKAAFAGALERVLADQDLAGRLGRAGQVSVRRFGWDAVVNQYLDIYRDAISP